MVNSKPQTSVQRYAAALSLVTIAMAGLAVFTLQGAPGRAIQEWKNSAGTVVARMSSGGALDTTGLSINGSPVGGGSVFGTGNVLTIGNARYVKKQGDTMTGALTILVTGGNSATLGINTQNTVSGSILYGYRGRFGVSLASSGTLTVVGSPRIQRIISIPLCDAVTACAVGSGVILRIPKMMDNYAFSGATLDAGKAGTTGTMSVQVINITNGKNLFTTKITLDSGGVSSDTAATPYVRNATLSDRTVVDGSRIMPRIDAVHTTPAQGVTINLHFIPL